MSNESSTSGPAPNRRDFIKSSALVTGGVLAGSLGIARSAHAAGSDELKLGLIGCGGRGIGALTDCFDSGDKLKLISMADMFPDVLEREHGKLIGGKYKDKIDCPKERQFSGFDAYQKVLDSGIDLVLIATPPGFRPVHFEAAVKAGKHVFMEKPVAIDPSGVRQVLAAAEESKKKNLTVGVGLQRRHDPVYSDLVKRIHDGVIGDVHTMRVYWNGQTPWQHPRAELAKRHGHELSEMEYQLRNWYYFVWLCGDHIAEQHIHNLDVAAWVKNGYPIRARGMGGCEVRKGPDYGEIFDHHAVEYEFADGSWVFSQCRHIPHCWNKVHEFVQGTKGTSEPGSGTINETGKERWKYSGGKDNPYKVEHVDMLKALRAGTPYNEAETGAKSTMMAIFGRMATYSGQEIKWDDALNSKISYQPKDWANLAMTATPPTMPMENGMYKLPVPGLTKVV
jgi:predicted dehydrogenase